jgi:ketosteroid isomerase-like protein
VFLDSLYAVDFRFKHASGQIQDRAQMLALVRRGRFAARDLDSLDVEVHGDVALSTGRIHVRRTPGAPPGFPPRYTIRYVRVYVDRNGRWRLLTHHTTGERPDSIP